MLFEYPVAQALLILVEGQIPVGGLAPAYRGGGQARIWVDQLGGGERRAACLALVAVGLLAAMGACASHVAVGQKLSGLGVIGLHGGLHLEAPLVIQMAEEFGCGVRVDVARGARIYVERYAQLLHRVADDGVVAVDDILGRDSLFACLDGDGHSVLVAATHHDDVVATQAEIARVYVGRHVDACEVTDVHRPVGVGQCGGYERSFEFLFHCCM